MNPYETLLSQLLNNDDRTIIMTAENRAAIRHLSTTIGQRFIDVGICEQSMIGMAAGLALRGRIPIVHALSAFLCMRAFEFIRTDVGIANLPVKLVGGVAGILSEANGPTHQALEDVSIMSGIPHVGVFCPADEEDMLIGLPSILSSPQPFYIRYTNAPRSIKHSREFSIGQAETFGEHGDVSIITYGPLLRQAFLAAELLNARGLSVSIVNVRCLKPIDEETLLIAAQRATVVVTLEDHFQRGGLYSILCELLVRHGAQATVLPIAFDERWFQPAMMDDVLKHEKMDGFAIAQRIEDFIETYRQPESWQIHYS